MSFLDGAVALGSLAGAASFALIINDRWQAIRPQFYLRFDRSTPKHRPLLIAVNPTHRQAMLQVPERGPDDLALVPTKGEDRHVAGAMFRGNVCVFPLDPKETASFDIWLPDWYYKKSDAYQFELRLRWRFLHSRPYTWKTERMLLTKRDFEQARDLQD